MIAALASAAALVCGSPGITDGDTFRCQDGTRIRLWGVDAPERYTPAGPAATRALARLITGQELRCTRKGRSHKRVVAQCFVGRLDLSAEMVRQGYAVDMPKFSGGYYRRFEW